jgi:hypothetical protein
MTTLFTDSLTRANGAIGPNYTQQSGHTATWVIASNSAQPSTFGSGDTMTAITAVAAPNDQWIQGTCTTIGAGGGSGFGLGVRMATGAVTHYRLVGGDSGAAGCTELSKEVAGAFTSLATSTDVWDTGAVMYIEVQGNQILCKRNGVTLFGGAITDNSLATGSWGLVYSSTPASGGITNVTAGDFAGSAISPVTMMGGICL